MQPLFPAIRGMSHSQHPVVRIRAHQSCFYLCLEVSSIESNISTVSVLCCYFLKATAACFCVVVFLWEAFARRLYMAVVLQRDLNADLVQTSP